MKPISETIISQKVYLLISFIEGASVMGVELLSAKMIAPFFGQSLYVWAAVLGVTLGGLAAGYFAGGIISKKYQHQKTLFYLFLAVSFLVLIMPVLGALIMTATLKMDLIAAAVLSCILFLFPPMLCFGMITPIIINNITTKTEDAGKISGKVYAVSTSGGIIMTFVTGLYLLPHLGIKFTVYLIAFLLFAVAIIYLIKKKTSIPFILLFVFVFSAEAVPGKTNKHSNIKVLYKSDGLLGQLFVADDKTTKMRSLHVNYTAQTFIDIPSGRSLWAYVHRIGLYSSYKPAGSSVLICGLGGGNLVTDLSSLGFNVDVVELDQRMPYIAKKFFFMNAPAAIFIDDARHYIKTCSKKYDIIIFDMLSAENQPTNMYTVECFNEMKKILSKNGIAFIHYQNVLEGEHALAAQSIGRTLEAAGLNTRIINTELPKNAINEIIFCASASPLELEKQTFERRDKFGDQFNFPTGQKIFLNFDFNKGLLLTDDKPIMDLLHLNTLSLTRGTARNSIIPVLTEQGVKIIE